MKKEDVTKILGSLKSNFKKSFNDMTKSEAEAYLDIWERGLQRIDDVYAWQALDFYMFESTDSFAPTIGQFLHKANEYKEEYERKHPVIRNAWEADDVLN